MADFGLVLSVILLFVVRIGIPLIVLIAIGTFIDRWQQKRRSFTYRLDEHK